MRADIVEAAAGTCDHASGNGSASLRLGIAEVWRGSEPGLDEQVQRLWLLWTVVHIRRLGFSPSACVAIVHGKLTNLERTERFFFFFFCFFFFGLALT